MRALMFGLFIALAACAPAANEPTAATPPPAAAVAAPPPAPAPAATLPQPAQRPPQDLLVQGGVDYSCNTPADCEVKNVGNCCGRFPQCVNKDSPTFPEQVKAECAAKGMSSVCGFQEIASCDCIEGRCTGVAGAGGTGELQKD